MRSVRRWVLLAAAAPSHSHSPSAAAAAWDARAEGLPASQWRDHLWTLAAEGDIHRCEEILRHLRREDALTTGAFAAVLRCCAEIGDLETAFAVLRDCQARGFGLDHALYLQLFGVLHRGGADRREILRALRVFLRDSRRFNPTPKLLDSLFYPGVACLPFTAVAALWAQAVPTPLSYRAYLALAHAIMHDEGYYAEIVHPLLLAHSSGSVGDLVRSIEDNLSRHPHFGSESYFGALMTELCATIRLHGERCPGVLTTPVADLPLGRVLAPPTPLRLDELLRTLLVAALRELRRVGPDAESLLHAVLDRMRRANRADEALALWGALVDGGDTTTALSSRLVGTVLGVAGRAADREAAVQQVLERLTHHKVPTTPATFVAILRALGPSPTAVQLYHQAVEAGRPVAPAAHALALEAAFKLLTAAAAPEADPPAWPSAVPPPSVWIPKAAEWIGPLGAMAAVDRNAATTCGTAFVGLNIITNNEPQAAEWVATLQNLGLTLGWRTLRTIRVAFARSGDPDRYHAFVRAHGLASGVTRTISRPRSSPYSDPEDTDHRGALDPPDPSCGPPNRTPPPR